MLRACLRISIEILSYQREFSWELARFETWRSQFTFDIWFFCTYLLFKSNIHVFVIVISSQTRFLTKRWFSSNAITKYITIFLAIIRCLKHWRFEFKKFDEFVEIFINHENLKIFMTFKKFTFRQIRWVEILIDYNIKIQYQFEIKNVKIDVLIRMFEFRSIEKNKRKRYRKQILLSFFKLQLCFIDVLNDLYERVM